MNPPGKIVCLSNVYDQSYHDIRGEDIPRCLSWGKRRDLFHCLELAAGKEVVVVSSPPKALNRRSFRWLPALETKFGTHRQFFCANLDGPKLRIPLSWIFYARHVLQHTSSGDVVMLDNYELIYVLAARLLSLFRKVSFVLDYEDGKHLIDRSLSRVLSGVAERLGRPLLNAALLAHPALGGRLPGRLPVEVVPGFIPSLPLPAKIGTDGIVHFLYSGSLDAARGINLLLDAIQFLPEQGWHVHVTGAGPLAESVAAASADPKWQGKMTFHGLLATPSFNELVRQCQVGVNLQRAGDPISAVTFPSKVFAYLSAGLLVISSEASEVEKICGKACRYFRPETSEALARAMREMIEHFSGARDETALAQAFQKFSLEGTAKRLGRIPVFERSESIKAPLAA